VSAVNAAPEQIHVTSTPTLTSEWRLDQHRAIGSSRAFQSQLDLDHPERGLQSAEIEHLPAPERILAIAPSDDHSIWPARLTDSYVRGPDLVASYAGTDEWPFAPSIYWIADACEPSSDVLASLRLVISIQTDLLDTHPRLDAFSRLPVDEVVMVSLVDNDVLVDSHGEGRQEIDPRATACGLIWRLPGSNFSYAELMPTSDFRQFAIDRSTGAVGSRWQLFGEFLEKGVIRRARLQALVVPRENDVQLVAEACQAIESRPLPLTT